MRHIPRMSAFWTCTVLLVSAYLARGADLPQGAAVFRSNCSFCHGQNGKGGRGPSLVSTRIAQNTTDDVLKSIVQRGIPGTGMPGFEIEQDDLEQLVKYIRSLNGSGAALVALTGDSVKGKTTYAKYGCANCHRIGDVGSVYGPELSRIGAARSPDYLRESVVKPSADIPQDYEGVTVVTKAGKRVHGIRMNEDTFTIQLRLTNQQFGLFDKRELQAVENDAKSAMPAYDKMPEADLDHLIAYLASLKGETSGADVNRAKGIH